MFIPVTTSYQRRDCQTAALIYERARTLSPLRPALDKLGDGLGLCVEDSESLALVVTTATKNENTRLLSPRAKPRGLNRSAPNRHVPSRALRSAVVSARIGSWRRDRRSLRRRCLRFLDPARNDMFIPMTTSYQRRGCQTCHRELQRARPVGQGVWQPALSLSKEPALSLSKGCAHGTKDLRRRAGQRPLLFEIVCKPGMLYSNRGTSAQSASLRRSVLR